MSTRCHVLVEGSSALIYRHSDGYPFGRNGVLSVLVPLVKDFMSNRGYDPEYLSAHILTELVMDFRYCRERFYARMKRAGHGESNDSYRNTSRYLSFGVEAFSPRKKNQFHSDIEYLYYVHKDGDITIRRPNAGFWDSPTLKNTDVYRVINIQNYVHRDENGKFAAMSKFDSKGYLRAAA